MTVTDSPIQQYGRPRPFGTLCDGRQVWSIAIANSGMTATVLTLGATLQGVTIGDGSPDSADVVLGFDCLQGYLSDLAAIGVSVGRVANRIGGARFCLDGIEYALPANEGGNTLHGGPNGFHKRLWDVAEATETSVRLRLVSEHLDQGFPGRIEADAIYALDDAGRLHITYEASTDRATFVNLTNHAYWNLSGARQPVSEHLLEIRAQGIIELDAASVPTGAVIPVEGSPFDFRKPNRIGECIDADDPQIVIGGGYDHCWVLDEYSAGQMRLVARLEDPLSGRWLKVHSDQAGMQAYTANHFDGFAFHAKTGGAYGKHAGIALELQAFPDSPNRREFPSIRLAPGDRYRNRMIFEIGPRPHAGPKI